MNEHNPEHPSLRIGFLLLNNFTMVALASAIEPLRMANHLSSNKLYEWFTISEDGNAVSSSNEVIVSTDISIAAQVTLDVVIVAGGIDITHSYSHQQLQWLKQLDLKGVQLGSICTGAYALAAAGLLDGQECSTHWECMASITENFPKVNNNNRLYSLSKDRLTCSGGIVPLDMMLTMIQQQHGGELVAAISDMLICDRVRSEDDYQRIPMKYAMGSTQPKLVELVSLMESNIEEPIALDELAIYVGTSRRQLERLFQKYLHCTPSRYYLRLRLARARQLLKQTSLSIIDVATACGFVSTPHFSKCYRRHMGIPPREERGQAEKSTLHTTEHKLAEQSVATKPLLLAKKPTPSGLLKMAQNEPSYGSVTVHR